MMPLIVKDFTWRQSGDTIVVNVKIKGIKAAKTSIVTADDYIRVHFHPYIFEVFLWGDVDDVGGNCTIDEEKECLVFEMEKVVKGSHWDGLEKDLCRDEKRAKRERAVELTQTRTSQAQETIATRRHEQKQMTVHEQIRLDDEERQRIEGIKNAERTKALSEMDKWREVKGEEERRRLCTSTSTVGPSKQGNCPSSIEKLLEVNKGNCSTRTGTGALLPLHREKNGECENCPRSHDDVCTCSCSKSEENPASASKSISHSQGKFLQDQVPSSSKSFETVRPNDDLSSSTCSSFATLDTHHQHDDLTTATGGKANSKPNVACCCECETKNDTAIWSNSDLTTGNFSMGKGDGDGNGDAPTEIPIRLPGRISVTFTAREFPTPSRESQAAEEAEWLKKQAEARRKCGFNDADLRPEERDPSWLLDKGLSLMKTGSFLGAVSAFSLGIKLAPKMPELYTERSSAHLALKNFHKAVEDSSQALELLTPKVAQNASDRLKCHKRRGVGFANLKMYEEALLDFQEGLLLQPDDEELLRERDNTQRALDNHQLNVSSSDED